MGFLSATSSLGILFAGIIILFCWIMAINDEEINNDKPGGCIELFKQYYDYEGFDKNVKNFLKYGKNAYTPMLSLSIVCGVLWIITAIMGFIKPTVYLIMGILSMTTYICSFVPILERLRYNQQCDLYMYVYNLQVGGGNPKIEYIKDIFKDSKWSLKYMYTSYEIFWGS